MNELLDKGITCEDVIFKLLQLYSHQEQIKISGKIMNKKSNEITATFDTGKNELIKKEGATK